MRKDVFVSNLREINEHNERFKRKEVTYTKAINKFADWTKEEMRKWFGGFKLWSARNMLPADIFKHEN